MSDWIPEVSIMNEEHELMLRFVRLYKQEKVYHQAVVVVLQMLGQLRQSAVAIQVADAIKAEEPRARQDVDALFQNLETALLSGTAYRSILRSLLDRLK